MRHEIICGVCECSQTLQHFPRSRVQKLALVGSEDGFLHSLTSKDRRLGTCEGPSEGQFDQFEIKNNHVAAKVLKTDFHSPHYNDYAFELLPQQGG